ncbi:MAG: 2-amino-4-hydroxy-6-hydroxymethyldihydropteridine diphosphokinase [Okeania sp. SIO3I5]|uniref:2-amino-4-hydroxy-6- hydroxymethyldihydropteridine diphosphokinase n=1 Tax=Okeania sp. SIO3I5 TaxID=2607805 RepID=UPI0013BBBC81|nr:2-amino-4-hydroxy-6-hydroxymethyldihydropteridine diphosphokinase [Okeania sp. SIO3I5]NEQ41177.1 2-amino-4-hydroxy-6-hydroxymethyldihydropteridine diphosphokinase [Okeania sp. SIO3I5]
MSNSINLNNSEKNQGNAAIGMGSNLGESLDTLKNAIQTLDEIPGINLITYSNWYRTKPIGGPPQPDYINGCALLKVELTPHKLLEILLETEQQFKRIRLEHWGPRTLDLDLILYDDLILDTPNLQIPHPRMRERAFVLVPLAEIAPDWIDPVSGKAIAKLLEEVECSGVSKL